MRKQLAISYEELVSVENLLCAWQEFVGGKRGKKDVQLFGLHMMDNILALHTDLENFAYTHGGYEHFKITDPKPRDIHKASVRDRLLHHAIYRKLYPFFDTTFIGDSYSCRLRKGTLLAINQFRSYVHKVSQNNTRTCWVLKCDIRKFFANIDHQTLYDILARYIPDDNIAWLTVRVISSFAATPGVGLPLGNLTSQLFVNIYMNEFDQFVKHKLKAKHYIRYADDFVFLSESREVLEGFIPQIKEFLSGHLKLTLHPHKVSITTLTSGVDFLGWVHFFDHRVLRTTTRHRMMHRLKVAGSKPETIQSYLGLLGHGNAKELQSQIREVTQRETARAFPV